MIAKLILELKFIKIHKIFRIIFYAFIALIIYPYAWFKSLYNSRILLKGQWDKYNGFYHINSIECFFYRTQWLNLNRYGRNGKAPFVGLGNYPIANWFHLSMISSYIFSNAGAVTTLFSSMVWCISNLIWLQSENYLWVISLTLVFLFSSSSYAMAFGRQNYQMLSWMFLPLSLYYTHQGMLIPSMIFLSLTAIFGLTQTVFAFPICILFSLENNSIQPFLAVAISSLFCAIRLLPLFRTNELKKSLINTLKSIGTIKSKSLYLRKQKFGISNIYLLSIYLIATFLCWYSTQVPPFILFLACLLFFINQSFFRIADIQSIITLVSTLFIFYGLSNAANIVIFIAVLIAINPYGQILSTEDDKAKIRIFEPYDHTYILDRVENLFSCVIKDEKIFCAFDDPNRIYSKIFNGYRVIHTLASYIGSKNKFHIFPDWYSVFDLNFEGSQNIWANNPKEVYSRCKEWKANYALIYQNSGTKLKGIWDKHFNLISEYDWNDYLLNYSRMKLWESNKITPKWFLLKVKH